MENGIESAKDHMTEHMTEHMTDHGECLNCGTKLVGSYCHECGQMKNRGDSSILGFILEYLNNAYMWDTQIMVTCWQLFTKPGYLTKRFLSGKYVSHSHPLKLNMFMLFVFFTLFFIFHEDEKINKSIHNLTRDERCFASMQVTFLTGNSEYGKKLENSPIDTIKLYAPLSLAEESKGVITLLEIHENSGDEYSDVWTAAVPRVFIEDGVLTKCCEEDHYHFNPEADTQVPGFEIIDKVSTALVNFFSNYFLLIVLATVPMLAFSIKLVHRKEKVPAINHLIFTLHYTALIEGVVLLLYILHLIANPSAQTMEWLIIITTNIYLAIAYKEVYSRNSWIKAGIKSLITNTVYSLILIVSFFVVFLIACICVVISMKNGV